MGEDWIIPMQSEPTECWTLTSELRYVITLFGDRLQQRWFCTVTGKSKWEFVPTVCATEEDA